MKNILSVLGVVLFLFAVGLFVGGAATRKNSEKISSSAPTGLPPIIDAHIHTQFDEAPEFVGELPNGQVELLKQFKEAGVVGAVSMTTRDGRGFVPELAKSNVIFCNGVGPKTKIKDVEANLKSRRAHCIKIYLGYIYKFASDPFYRSFYQLAEKYNVPVVFHTGDTEDVDGKLKFSDPLTVDEVAVDFRKVNFVIAHLGNPWIQSAAEVAYKNPNVWMEGSALLIGDLAKTPKDKLEEFVIKPVRWAFGYVENPKKLIFGTDWPLSPIKEYAETFSRAVPKEYWKDVFYNNALMVYKIPGLKPLP